MNFFKDNVRVFLKIRPEGSKSDYNADIEQVNMLIGFNNITLSIYHNYLIALLSIMTPIFITLVISSSPIWLLVIFSIFNVIIVYFLYRKISSISYSNDQLIELFNGIQAKKTGSKIFVIEGNKKNIFEIMKKFQEKATEFSPNLPPSYKKL